MVEQDPTVLAYQRRVSAIRAQVAGFIGRIWARLPVYRDDQMRQFIDRVVPVVLAAQARVADLTDAYLARLLLANGLQPLEPAAAPLEYADMRAGTNPDEVYQRPFIEIWTLLSRGEPIADAVASGLRRAQDLAGTDIQLARTHTARQVLAGDRRITGHRRVLNGPTNCGLCVVASTQRYHRDQLQPIHPGCDCGVAPIWGDRDPGQVIDQATLEGAHTAIQERFGAADRSARDPIDYRDLLLTREHGELGPVLTVAGQRFTGPADL